jgi:hypothetical protein
VAKKTAVLDATIKRQWNLEGLASDLDGETWHVTEQNRIDRTIFLASYENISALAQESVSKKEWKEAEQDGFEHEIVDEYLDRLAELVAEKMGKHVYGTLNEGDAFLGQYEDGHIEELRSQGFVIED